MKKKQKQKNTSIKQRNGVKRWWLIGTATVAALALLVGGLWYIFGNNDQEPTAEEPNASQTGNSNQQTGSTQTPTTRPGEDDQPDTPSVPVEGTDPTETTNPSETTEPTQGNDIPDNTQPTEDTRPNSGDQQGNAELPTESGDEPIVDEGVTFIQGIKTTSVMKYTGIYMEDGTNELVSDVMMMIVENETSSDLQLARIDVEYDDFTAEFQVTNLPAGKSVVVLEQNRKAYIQEEYRNMTIKDVVFFQENMNLCEDRVKITGTKGMLEIENISGETLGVVYVYFKNTADDGLLYGGITYRTTVDAGLKPGETRHVTAGHYDPDFTELILVQIGENVS